MSNTLIQIDQCKKLQIYLFYPLFFYLKLKLLLLIYNLQPYFVVFLHLQFIPNFLVDRIHISKFVFLHHQEIFIIVQHYEY